MTVFVEVAVGEVGDHERIKGTTILKKKRKRKTGEDG